MARGALRGAMSAALGLIALQAVSSKKGSGRISGLLTDVNGLVLRVLDPTVPAIPDRRQPRSGQPATGSAPAATAPTPRLPTPVPVNPRYRNIPE